MLFKQNTKRSIDLFASAYFLLHKFKRITTVEPNSSLFGVIDNDYPVSTNFAMLKVAQFL
jgi:hypothetical protein